MKKLYLLSLGCNKNLVDSQIMLGRLGNYQVVDKPDDADVMIVNTCGFIASAKEESINAILELAQYKKDDGVLVVTGCLMQRYKDELIKELPEVDIFSGVGDYDKIDEMILKKQNLFSPQTYLQKSEKRVITGSNYHAYIKLSEGCNQKCSFCAIPTFKGKLRSRSIDDIVDEISNLVNQGYYDFSFISQDSSSYGRDLGKKDGLCELIDRVEKIDGVKFARILYLYPTTTSDELVQKIIDSKVFLNYFDMPIQHISNNMLKIMKRGANKERIIELLAKMREAKDSFVRSGFIVGHPGESEKDFDELCEFLKSFSFDRVSIFAYSKEEDTASFNMEQIPQKIVTKRLNMIEKITNQTTKESFEKELGKTSTCVVEGYSSEGEMFFGAKKYIWDKDIDGEILINDSNLQNLEVGKTYTCKFTDFIGDKLVAEIIS
ncbi:radical SAM methylthiotransferase, MiaB/RimO family [Campylobacter blaseri]|uniref:Ribosomal protein uS12 methylthiotransferase RimO n=1 Tax=Campylobacter blaseri TaxID=2042961 RepID=A0A2P8R1E0_9BACT|nr:30S ribosomal protein S12 methylthiotransferase RimO [Campylobacter blaseri]PSM52304.1 30S ribosomal protein S12 methylthiotransferase RimO [Campylobacter blaseri]PSM54070.1 30S ribosomal protein S12 methylthiotransferase RimO [Campylobacter blaseri]QKF85512.1 radical SAM methylthiotransferase, MiaB/RimO family [Campylobacter blaseri]